MSNHCSSLFLIPFLVQIHVVFQEYCQLSEICSSGGRNLCFLEKDVLSSFWAANWMIHDYMLRQHRQQFFFAWRVLLCMLVKTRDVIVPSFLGQQTVDSSMHNLWNNTCFFHCWWQYQLYDEAERSKNGLGRKSSLCDKQHG